MQDQNLYYRAIDWGTVVKTQRRTKFFNGKSRTVKILIDNQNELLPSEAKQTIETYYLFSKTNKESCVYGYDYEYDEDSNLVNFYNVEICL
jgi:hypothetical protein